MDYLFITILCILLVFIIIYVTLTLQLIWDGVEFRKKIKSTDYGEYNKVIRPSPIVFLGDSITEGYPVHEFFPDLYVVNRGIASDISQEVLYRLYSNVIVLKPKKIFLLIGTNDIPRKKHKPHMVENIEKMIQSIQKNTPNSKLYLESLLPVNRNFRNVTKVIVKSRRNPEIEEFNKKLRALAEKYSITFIDIATPMKDIRGDLRKEFTIEGLHLNHEGYVALTKTLRKYVEE